MITIVVAAGCSYVVASPKLALASAVAFLVSELADFAVYTPLRSESFVGAIALSNLVGATIDTLLFLNLAGFGVSGGLFYGQLLVKVVWVTAPVLVVHGVVRGVLPGNAPS